MQEPSREVPSRVLSMCKAIDHEFLAIVGPFGSFVVEEVRDEWLGLGKKINGTHAAQYLQMLAAQIPNAERRENFVARSLRHLR